MRVPIFVVEEVGAAQDIGHCLKVDLLTIRHTCGNSLEDGEGSSCVP